MQLQNRRKELLYLYKKGLLSDSHYKILDKKAADFIEGIKGDLMFPRVNMLVM